jgi:hypothetical protein
LRRKRNVQDARTTPAEQIRMSMMRRMQDHVPGTTHKSPIHTCFLIFSFKHQCRVGAGVPVEGGSPAGAMDRKILTHGPPVPLKLDKPKCATGRAKSNRRSGTR